MKKQLLLGIALGVCFGVSAQQNRTVTGQLVPKIKPAVANKAVVFNPYASETPNPAAAPVHPAHPHHPAGSSQAKAYTSTVMGSTIYDLQTNASIAQTAVLNPDGTISTVFNLSTASTASAGTPDRGTGYNYFNGTSWGVNPATRLESVRTGWPSIGVTTGGAEVTVSHLADGSSHDIVMMSRPVKGTGTWTQTSTGIADTWPRMVVGGSNGQTVHMIAESQGASPTNPAYMGMISALTYSRSLDGGVTWDINRSVIPQIDASHYYHFNGDDYDIDVNGDAVAIVAGGLDNDVVLLKSADNGATWTKTIVKQFPIPMFDATTMITDTNSDGTADTLETNDGSVQVLLDDNGMAHVWYGNMRMINDAPSSTGAVSYFPGTDGLMYWNESMGSSPAVMIAAAQDLDGDGVLNVSAFGTYYVSLTSMPSASIDAFGNLFLSYSSIYEGLSDDGTIGGGKSYRHTFLMASPDHGLTWCDPIDITDPFAGDYVEGVFGSLTRKTDGNVHLFFQSDASPGHGLSGTPAGSTDPQSGPSDIVYVQMPTSDLLTCLTSGIATHTSSLNSLAVYPNPASNNANLEFSVAHKGNVVIKVYNVTGQMVAQLTNQDYAAGKFNISLNLEKYKAGIYMINMTTAEGTSTQKLIVQ